MNRRQWWKRTEQQQEVAVEINAYTGVTGEEENESYILPPPSLLKQTPIIDQSEEYNSIQANAQKLERTFLSFGVKAKVTEVHLGPAVRNMKCFRIRVLK